MKFLNKNYLEEDHNKTGTLVDKARQKQERIAIHLNTPSMLPQSRDNVIVWLLFNYIKTSKENYFEYWLYKIYTKYILLVPCGFLFKKKKLTQSSRENSRDLPFSQIAIMGMLCFSRGSRFMKMYWKVCNNNVLASWYNQHYTPF